MSIVPPLRSEIVQPDIVLPEARKSRGVLAVVAGVLGVLLIIGISGYFWTLLRNAEDRFQALSQRIDRLEDKQQSLDADLRQAHVETQAAEQRATKSEQARAESVEETVQAQAAKTLADQQAAHAQQQAQSARDELVRMRKAREDEMNRMQEALAKVAAARRTPDGIVVDLSNDSFKFDFDKSALRSQNRELLSRLAGILLASHGFRLHIYGYTDDIGTGQYNQGLSERRAHAVYDYLAQCGIQPDIMASRGFGKSSPRVRGPSEEAREKNRRVEIAIIDTSIHYEEGTQ
jgi:outer membrane protein OmpA-like peptidoglycan-associated protein